MSSLTIEQTPKGLYFPDAVTIAIPTPEETALFISEGLTVDSEGRPLHPEFLRVLGEHGVRFGKGEFWRLGPNKTVDPVIIAEQDNEQKVLTIVRKNNGKRALTGGFLDLVNNRWEEPVEAGIREASEEALIDISRDEYYPFFSGPVRDERETLNAWPFTYGILFKHDGFSPVTAGDDAVPGSAEWLRLDEIDLAALHGSHAMLITAAFERYYELRKN